MLHRGTYNFEVNNSGDLIYSKNNVELLRTLWVDKKIITTEELGPGDPGDFDNGSWHSACHLVAAGGVRRTNDGRLLWLEISYSKIEALYKSTLTVRNKNNIVTIPLNSSQAQPYLIDSELLGFVEGTSEGRISAANIIDDEKIFNNNPRQEYDQQPGSPKEGGKVWEHWCTTRDIRGSSLIGSSVLDSYVALVAACGDKFIPTVARGRKDYGHPAQLNAMIKAGVTSIQSANCNINPLPIPEEQKLLFQEATPESSFLAIEKLDWRNPPKYFMFSRAIEKWNDKVII